MGSTIEKTGPAQVSEDTTQFTPPDEATVRHIADTLWNGSNAARITHAQMDDLVRRAFPLISAAVHAPDARHDQGGDEAGGQAPTDEQTAIAHCQAIATAARHPYKGPVDTDASMLLEAAQRAETGHTVGGSHTQATVGKVLRAVAAALSAGEHDG